jgi:hypothetical protein
MRNRLFALLFLVVCSLVLAQQAMNNDAVIKMAKAGLSDDVIVTTINASPGTYDTTADGLVALKQAGVSDKVIAAIVAKATPAAPSAPTAAPAPSPIPPGVDSIGVYYQDGGNWQMLPVELAVFESGGKVKHVATAGLVKQDLNAVVNGSRSRLVVKTPATFLLHIPDGLSPNDFRLFRLHVSGNNRQFQSLAGALGHESSSGVRDDIEFMSKEIAPSVYKMVVPNDVGDGEFGFLEPQDASSKSPPVSGKIFTFAIVK